MPEELGGGSVSGDGVADLASSPSWPVRPSPPGPLHPVSTVLAGLVEAPENHEATIESLVSGEAVGSWAVYEPAKPWSPLDAAVTARRTDTGYRIDGVKDRVRRVPRARCCWSSRSARARSASSWCRRTRREYASRRSVRSIL